MLATCWNVNLILIHHYEQGKQAKAEGENQARHGFPPILKYSYPLTGRLFLDISQWFTVSAHMLFLSGLSWDCATDADGYGTICCNPGYREILVSAGNR